MPGVRSIKDIEAMTQDQIATILRSSAKALVADPTDAEASVTFFLLNDYAVSKWLAAAASATEFKWSRKDENGPARD